jgi:hypothetical protein
MEFDITSRTGLSLRQIPQVVRDLIGMADTRSFAAYFGDPTLNRDPRELWMGTVSQFGKDVFGVKPRQAQDNLARIAGEVYREGNLIITVQGTADQIRRNRMREVSERRRQAAKSRWDVSSGTSATAVVHADVAEEVSGAPLTAVNTQSNSAQSISSNSWSCVNVN